MLRKSEHSIIKRDRESYQRKKKGQKEEKFTVESNMLKRTGSHELRKLSSPENSNFFNKVIIRIKPNRLFI